MPSPSTPCATQATKPVGHATSGAADHALSERVRRRPGGEDILAQIARDLVDVMRRDVRTDWTVRDDVRAKLRASIKRLLVKNGYPPDKQPDAIRLVMEQMESMAPRYADDRSTA